MKKIFYTFLGILLPLTTVFADDNTGVFWNSTTVNNLRNWNITFDDIPKMIKAITEFILGFSATISMIMIIVWALQIALGSVENDTKKWKATIQYGIIGFAVSVSAWFIVNAIVANL